VFPCDSWSARSCDPGEKADVVIALDSEIQIDVSHNSKLGPDAEYLIENVTICTLQRRTQSIQSAKFSVASFKHR
jgi:hypothetical protein